MRVNKANLLAAVAVLGIGGRSVDPPCLDPQAKPLREIGPKPAGSALPDQRFPQLAGHKGKGTRKSRRK